MARALAYAALAKTSDGGTFDLNQETKDNEHYRHVLYTGNGIQIVLYALAVGEDIPEEDHEDGTQLLFGAKGLGTVRVAGRTYALRKPHMVIVEPGQRHHVSNARQDKTFKFYSIYAPPQWAEGHMDERQP